MYQSLNWNWRLISPDIQECIYFLVKNFFSYTFLRTHWPSSVFFPVSGSLWQGPGGELWLLCWHHPGQAEDKQCHHHLPANRDAGPHQSSLHQLCRHLHGPGDECKHYHPPGPHNIVRLNFPSLWYVLNMFQFHGNINLVTINWIY